MMGYCVLNWRQRALVALILAVAVRPCAANVGDQGNLRPAVPKPAELRKAREEVRKVFAVELQTAAKHPAPLVRKLLDAGEGTREDPPSRYACFDEALGVAVSAGAADLALEVAEVIARHFAVDKAEARANALTMLGRERLTPEQAAGLAEAWLELVADARNAGDYDAAYRLLPQARSAATRSRDPGVAADLKASMKDIVALRRAWASLSMARQKLSQTPDDPAANLAVGKFLCYRKGDWPAGVGMLAKGSDEAIKAAAAADEAKPTVAEAMLAVGDSWWDLADKQTDRTAAEAMKVRAGAWYDRALPKLSGLTKAKYDNRVRESGFRLQGLPAFTPAGATAAINHLRRDRHLHVYASFDRKTITKKGDDLFVVNLAGKGSTSKVWPGASVKPGKLGEGMLFGSQQTRVRFGGLPPHAGGVTVMAWARWPEAPDGGIIHMSCAGQFQLVGASPGIWCKEMGRKTAKKPDGSALELSDGQWYHLALTYDGTTLTIYVDAAPVLSFQLSGSIGKSDSVLVGGAVGWPAAKPCRAVLDEVYFLGRVLRAREIRSYYGATAGAPAD